MAYGLVDQRMAEQFPELKDEVKKTPLIEYGKYIGIVSAPLKTANFVPDIVLIYSNNAQLNNMLHALSFAGEGMITLPVVRDCFLRFFGGARTVGTILRYLARSGRTRPGFSGGG